MKLTHAFVATQLINPEGKKHSSLFCQIANDKQKRVDNLETWAKCFKTFYSCNLLLSVIC
jgi:hypothetical protein